MRIRSQLSLSNSLLTLSDFPDHQWLLLDFLLISLHFCISSFLFRFANRILICLCACLPDSSCLLLRTGATRCAPDFILMHRLQRPCDTQKQNHQPFFRKLCMVDQIRVYSILQVASPVVWQEYIDCLATRVRPVVGRSNGVIN